MNAQAIYEQLKQQFPESIEETVLDVVDPHVFVKAADIAGVARYLKETDGLAFDFLESISGVDTTEEVHLVYHLLSYKHRHSAVLKIRTTYEAMDIPTVSNVLKAANWHEREQFDLFGFNFLDHPDLRRLLLPEDWEGHPLRKSYEYPEEYHGIEHYRPDPKDQFKALDVLAAKAAAKVQEAKAAAEKATDDSDAPV